MRWLLLLGLVFALTGPAGAHDIWVSASYDVLIGHPGEAPKGYPGKRIKQIRVLGKDGSAIGFERDREDGMTRIAASDPPAAILVRFDNGYYTKVRQGNTVEFKAGKADQFPDAIESRHYVKYNKTIFRWGKAARSPQALPLEIVPLTDPAKLAGDDPLPLRVLHEGKPLSGVRVVRARSGQRAEAETDGEGYAELPYQDDREQLYTVHHTVPSTQSHVDQRDLASSLYMNLER